MFILLDYIKKKNNGRQLIIKIVIHENFPEIEKHLNLHAEMAPWLPGKIKPRWLTLRHSLVKLLGFKDKDKFLKVSRQKDKIFTKPRELD